MMTTTTTKKAIKLLEIVNCLGSSVVVTLNIWPAPV